MEPPRITGVEPTGNYSLELWFSDGAFRHLDLMGLISRRRALRPLCDPGLFRQVYVNKATHSISWPGGIDLNPDALYGLEQRTGIRVIEERTPRDQLV